MSDKVSYPDLSQEEFPRNLSKFEFSSHNSDNKKEFIYQDPNQLLIRNYISKPTMYENVLLYNGLGTGKSCAAIVVAENFKEYVNNLGRKVVVLIKNKNIQQNFMNELLSKCTGNDYVTDEQRDLYYGVNVPRTAAAMLQRKELVAKLNRLIYKSYQFITYGTFVNQVIGAKDYEKDELGQKTNKLRKVNGKVVRKRANNSINDFSNTVVIVDEAHNVTNNDMYIALKDVLSRSYNYRLVLLTATPMYDNPKQIFELSNLLNISNSSLQLPIRMDLLKPDTNSEIMIEKAQSQYINDRVLKGGILSVTKEGHQRLREALYGKVSYIQPNTDTNPSTHEAGQDLIKNRLGTSKVVYCLMSDFQYRSYIKALNTDVSTGPRVDISMITEPEAGETTIDTPTFKSGSLYKNSSDASTMSYPGELYGKEGFTSIFNKREKGGWEFSSVENKNVLTTDLKKYSRKLYNLIKNVKKSPGNVFIYSNYVSFGGTTLIKQVLLANGFKDFKHSKSDGEQEPTFVVFDESTNIETREKFRQIFNSPANKDGERIKIIIGSPIISEGITLKNVRQVHILEPCWNMSRINQIIGRAVRNYSHQDLDPEDRTVDIYKYVSIYIPKTSKMQSDDPFAKFSIDREKYILSEEKDRANKKVERTLKEISFDCDLMKNRNQVDSSFDGKAQCDYQNCNFSCMVKLPDDKINYIDKSTYNLNIVEFEKFDIYFVVNTLRDIFKKYFIWTLDDIVDNIRQLQNNISDEVIFATLGHITENKVLFTDAYNREGFILNKGPYYIFNSSDIDVESSLYTKMLDFSVDRTKYNLDQYVKAKFDTSVFENKDTKDKKKPKPKPVKKLSDTDTNYNYKIINNNVIFGTFRQRGSKENPFGLTDDKFRIVDLRKMKQNTAEDKRKNISGMWIGSYKKPQLIDVAKFLKIKTTRALEDHDKNELGVLIKKNLVEKNKVLK
jgi:superfamily II DNA or RNA helicase